jgi:hypothetical protein
MKSTSKNILATFFIAFVFVLGYIPFRQAVLYTREFFTTDNYNLETYVGKMNKKYTSFLPDTDGEYPGTSKMDYINLNSKMANIFDQKIQNGVIKLNNGYIILEEHAMVSPNSPGISENVKNTVALANVAESNGADFLYISIPAKVDENQYPVGIESTTREASQKFLGLLEENNISYINMYEEWQKQGIDPWDMLCRTDNHYTIEGAFSTLKTTSEYLLNKYKIENNFEQLDLSNYEFEIYPKQVYGSEGRRVGKTFCEPDDVQVIYPKFDTSIDKKSSSEEKTGNFNNIFLNNRYPGHQYHPYADPFSAVYNGFGNQSVIQYTNTQVDCIDKKILLIGDSHTQHFIPFAAITFKSIYCIYQNKASAVTKENIDKVIEEYKPDVIIKLEFQTNANNANTYK